VLLAQDEHVHTVGAVERLATEHRPPLRGCFFCHRSLSQTAIASVVATGNVQRLCAYLTWLHHDNETRLVGRQCQLDCGLLQDAMFSERNHT